MTSDGFSRPERAITNASEKVEAFISQSNNQMDDYYVMEGRFSLGQLFETRAALAVLVAEDVTDSIRRHVNGDWGDVSLADKEENERSLKIGLRLVSAYHDRNGVKFWIITEAERNMTTVLLPEEY